MTITDELTELGYTDLSVLGQGGFGTVYGGIETAFGRPVAIKVIQTRLDEDAERRFDRERRAIAVLPAHPHIVTVYAIARTGSGMPFFVMERVDGGSLRDRVGQRGWQDAFRIGVQLAGALETAHRAGVIHRDVKPENVLVGRYDEAKLTDFGIATLTSGGATTTAAVTATISHAAPEILGGGPAGPASDVYSLASTVHTLVAGVAPFPAGPGGMPELIARIAMQPPPSLVEHGVPPAVAAVILGALAKAPEDRPQTAEAFGLAMAAALRESGAEAPVMAIAAASVVATVMPGDAEVTDPTGATGNATMAGRRGPVAPAPVAAEAAPGGRGTKLVAMAAAGVLVLGGAAVAVAQPWQSGQKPVASPNTPLSSTPKNSTSAKPQKTASDGPDRPGKKGQRGDSGTPGGTGGTGDSPTTQSPSEPRQTDSAPTDTSSGNVAPTLAGVASQQSSELSSVTLRLQGSDRDGDRLTYSASGLPAGLSINGTTGVISGAPKATAASITSNWQNIRSRAFEITVRVSDGHKSGSRSFIWSIRDTALVMPNYFNAYGCGSSCSPSSPTDAGKPNISWIGPIGTGCTTNKPAGVNDTDKIVKQSVAAGSTIRWGTKVTYTYYQNSC